MLIMKKYQIDLDIYNNKLKLLNKVENECSIYETSEHPMHPHLFYQLSCVNGFNNLNGKKYQEYLNMWIQKYENK